MSAPSQRRLGRAIALGAGLLLAALIATVVASALRAATFPVDSLATRAPERTAMMRQREAEASRAGRTLRIDKRWVPYARLSPLLRHSVLVAEDDAFYHHGGLDWNEIGASARKNLEKRRIVRGGSTITQQLAKNVYLGDARTPLRKLTELMIAMRLERALSKRRILELYLNLIEWGDGVFGAEAAARHYFGVSAADLNERQAALLAAIVINPRRYSPLQPARRIEKRVRMIASRLRRRGLFTETQYQLAIGNAPAPPSSFSEWFFGAPEPPAAPPAEPEAVPSDSGAAPDTAALEPSPEISPEGPP